MLCARLAIAWTPIPCNSTTEVVMPVKQDRFPPSLSYNVVCTPILLIPVHVLGPDVGVRLVCESW